MKEPTMNQLKVVNYCDITALGVTLLSFLFFFGCEKKPLPEGVIQSVTTSQFSIGHDSGVFDVQVDGCHYIVASGYRAVSIIHKANCPNHKQLEKAER